MRDRFKPVRTRPSCRAATDPDSPAPPPRLSPRGKLPDSTLSVPERVALLGELLTAQESEYSTRSGIGYFETEAGRVIVTRSWGPLDEKRMRGLLSKLVRREVSESDLCMGHDYLIQEIKAGRESAITNIVTGTLAIAAATGYTIIDLNSTPVVPALNTHSGELFGFGVMAVVGVSGIAFCYKGIKSLLRGEGRQ